MKRIYSIDFCRGLVMIIMALDHTRDFLHVSSLTQRPTDLATTTPVLFFTRWITHLCAPTFVLLSGVSAWLSSKSRPNARENRLFLLKRGIWLIILEFTVVNFGLWMDIHFRSLILEVIAAIGFGFIILSLLHKVPPRILGVVGLIIIFGHEFLSSFILPAGSAMPPNHSVSQTIEIFLLDFGIFQFSPHLLFLVGYPLLPWLGIMLIGFACGRLFEDPVEVRKKKFLRIGIAALVLFVLLRWINVYGDPARWSVQKNAVFTFLSFINVSKYPPSLLFTLVTLGISFLVLSFSEGKNNKFIEVVSVYGKTPLFYFLIHLYVIHFIMFIMVFLQSFRPQDLDFGPLKNGRPAQGSGIGLPYVYLVWLFVVMLMYPLCLKYGRYKATHRNNKWLRYM